STPAGRKAGAHQSVPQTTAAPASPAAVEKARLFESSTGRASGRCAAKTTVASVTPSRAIQAVTSAGTVMNATVPLPEGPSAPVRGELVAVTVVRRSELQNRGRRRVDVARLDAEAAQRGGDVMAGRVSDPGRDGGDPAREGFQDPDLRGVSQRRREADVSTLL